jgi:hypothetical protein
MTEEKKIIVDEDWKSKVRAEKESFEKESENPQPEVDVPHDPPMPPASLEMLLTTLATEAMMALGQIPHPTMGKMLFQPNQAKFLIDTIGVIKEKTSGNLTTAETQAIDNLIHQLRMVYVAGPQETAPAPDEAAGEATSSIELPGTN